MAGIIEFSMSDERRAIMRLINEKNCQIQAYHIAIKNLETERNQLVQDLENKP